MTTRPACLDDIPHLHAIRLAVRENVLHDPGRVTPEDYRVMLEGRGRGWVHERDGRIVAFGIADRTDRNVWALFVAPGFERQGIGRNLLRTMVDWLFGEGPGPIWLTTEPGTRAERLYRSAGWHAVGVTEAGEIRFEWLPPDDSKLGSSSGA